MSQPPQQPGGHFGGTPQNNPLPSLPRLTQGFGSLPGHQHPMQNAGHGQTAPPLGVPQHQQIPHVGRPGAPPHHQQFFHNVGSVQHQQMPPQVQMQPRSFPIGHGTATFQQNMHAPPPVPTNESPIGGGDNNSYRPLNVRDALTYLDDVKEQFRNEPAVYHRFLDVMKDFKMNEISTPGVIERVSTLFRGHPNLIVGFNTFLPPGFRIEVDPDQAGSYTITTPETSMHINHQPQPPVSVPKPATTTVPPSSSAAPSSSSRQVPAYESSSPAPPAAAVLPQSVTANIPAAKKQPVEFNHAINYVNKIKNRYADDPDTYRQFLELLRTYQNDSRPIQDVYEQVQVLFQNAPDLQEEFKQFLPDSAVADSQKPGDSIHARSQADSRQFQSTKSRAIQEQAYKGYRDRTQQMHAGEEFDFFERVKKVLGNKTSYSEFLKVLNLFNQDIIDPKLLIEKIEPFLARAPELFDWFKAYVKLDQEPAEIVRAETPPREVADLKRSGSSYRMLPTSYVQASCGGRDAHSQSVLNDRWICHPTWASEDGGFVAHQKNQFEDALFRCEEERYEFDLSIEANKSVIQRLEPIARKIAKMSPEQQANFRLPNGLGDGMSSTIYKRIIKKIYDRDRGEEVIDALHEHPSVVIPIVLKRLKQKDEEWRRSQREWNKVWREIDAKNFYKSLDHQGLNFKNSDKKSLTSKSLTVEIEALYRERHEKNDPSLPKYHLKYEIKDLNLQQDIHRLMLSYLEKASQFSAEDIGRVNKFLKSFLRDMKMFSGEEKTANWTSAPVCFFGNSSYYLFFRLYQLAYDRLQNIRDCANDISKVSTGKSRIGLQTLPRSLDLISNKETSPYDTDDDIYATTLILIEKLFENEIEAVVFEEQTRFWYGTSAYVLYTVDKHFHSLCKQIVHMVSDNRCTDLMGLFRGYLRGEKSSMSEYRQSADEIVEEDENLYKIEYSPDTSAVTIELLGDDGDSGDVGNTEMKWTNYIDGYVKRSISTSRLKNPVFLKRTVKKTPETTPPIVVNNLECKISVNSYKMFFMENSEDFFWRKGGANVGARSSPDRFWRWWNGGSGWANNAGASEVDELQSSCEKILINSSLLGKHNFSSSRRKEVLNGKAVMQYITSWSSQ